MQIELLVAFGYLSIIPLYLKSIVQHSMFFSQHICSKFPVLIMLQVHPWDVWDWWYIRVFLFSFLFCFLAKPAGMKDLCSPERSKWMPSPFSGLEEIRQHMKVHLPQCTLYRITKKSFFFNKLGTYFKHSVIPIGQPGSKNFFFIKIYLENSWT